MAHLVHVTLRKAPGAAQAVIPVPGRDGMLHWSGPEDCVATCPAAAFAAWREQWAWATTVVAEESIMRYQVTIAAGEQVIALPIPSATKRTRVYEDRENILELTEAQVDQCEQLFNRNAKPGNPRVRFTALPEAPAEAAPEE